MTDKPNQASAREVVPASSPREQRREGRYDVPFPIEVSGVDPDGQVFYQRTSTRNVSEWGCGFLLSIELKEDDIIALRVLSDGPEASAQTRPSLFQVRHVVRDQESWLIGAWRMVDQNVWGVNLKEIAEPTSATANSIRRDTRKSEQPRKDVDQ